MKKTCFWLLLICLPAVAQILSPIFFQSSNVIAYCSVPGYPAAPYATGLAYKFSADCITFTSSVCGTPADGTSLTTWEDSSGNSRTATYNSQGSKSVFHTNVIGSLPAVTGINGRYDLGGSAIGSNDVHTLFGVYQISSAASYNNLSGNDGFGQIAFQTFTGTAKQDIGAGAGGHLGTGTASLSTNTWYSTVMQESGSVSGPGFTILFHLNRAVDTTASSSAGNSNATPPTGLFYNTVDNCCGFGGKVAELLYYNAFLTSAQIVYNECYLYGKWGL